MSVTAPSEIRLANQIAVHFNYLASDQAATAVADHIRRFWDPRMKKRLAELVDSDTAEFDPVALAANKLLVASPKATPPATADAVDHGSGSDAG